MPDTCFFICNTEESEMQPEVIDVYNCLKSKSLKWDEIGRELKIPFEFREGLELQRNSSDHNLECIIYKWKESESSIVSWNTIIAALDSLQLTAIKKDVLKYLKSDSDAVRKYNWKDPIIEGTEQLTACMHVNK